MFKVRSKFLAKITWLLIKMFKKFYEDDSLVMFDTVGL